MADANESWGVGEVAQNGSGSPRGVDGVTRKRSASGSRAGSSSPITSTRNYNDSEGVEHNPPPRKKVRFLEEDESDPDSEDEGESEADFESEIPAPPNVNLATSSTNTNPSDWEEETPFEEHIPGVNDIMSGGFGTFSPPRQTATYPDTISTDDASVSRLTIEAAAAAMPYCILDRAKLAELDLFQGNFPAIISPEFQTTYLGVQRALENAYACVFQDRKGGSMEMFDAVLLREIWKRAGWFEKDRGVNYVEDLTPVVGWGEGGFDAEYWGLVWSQGTIWAELGMEEESKEEGEGKEEEEGEEWEGHDEDDDYEGENEDDDNEDDDENEDKDDDGEDEEGDEEDPDV